MNITGEAHYNEAERLLAVARAEAEQPPLARSRTVDMTLHDSLVAEASVHAQLAQAAASLAASLGDRSLEAWQFLNPGAVTHEGHDRYKKESSQ